MEDQEIVALYFQRDQAAVSATDQKYGPFCRRVAENILTLREDAEECVNDTYHAAWRAMPPQRPQSLRIFFGRITRDLAISRWRKHHTQKRYGGMEVLLSELEDCLPAPQSIERAAEAHALGGVISRWLEGLAEEDRGLFLRRYWYGDPLQALAKERGCAPNALAQRMARLRKSLRRAPEAEGEYL